MYATIVSSKHPSTGGINVCPLTDVFRYVCIKSVFILTTECTSLAVTLVVTLRKFVSLLFSIVYFQNAFTPVHWLGTALVFSGTFLFLEVIPKLVGALRAAVRETGPEKAHVNGDTAAVGHTSNANGAAAAAAGEAKKER